MVSDAAEATRVGKTLHRYPWDARRCREWGTGLKQASIAAQP